jgi:nucleotide-binding universal stress UspA family protein
MTAHAHPVTVLVTGTAADRAALRLAAAEALLRDHPLLLIATYVRPDAGAEPISWSPQLAGAREAALGALSWLRESHPHLSLDYRIVPGDPADALVSRSAEAVAIVVPALAGGTVTLPERVAAHAHCPVLVSHVPAAPGGDVVVGLDGGAPADPLVRFAFEAAALRGAVLRPVMVWGSLPGAALGTLDPFAFDRADATGEVDRLLAEELAGWTEKQPDVVVRREAAYGPDVAGALTRHSSDAALLVVGARSLPARSGQSLGAVPRRLIRQAPCPVAVIRLGP